VALAFRQRIFAWLVAVSVVPAVIAVGAALLAPRFAVPVGGARAWDQAADSWRGVRRAVRPSSLDAAGRLALARHDSDLATSVRRARQAEVIREAFNGVVAAMAIALAVLVGGGAIRLAGHLSRQLSRPMDELVEWTGKLQRGESLPDAPPARGAPEFAVLRDAFRRMASELERARAREVEAAELRAFREMARQVAHELKNPLTPMRFALARLAKDAPPERQEMLDVLEAESQRLERMARDFGDLGRLPEGPAAPVDMGELIEELSRGRPEHVTVTVTRAPLTPRVAGHYEQLRRTISNLVLNAFDAVTPGSGVVALGARGIVRDGRSAVEITVRDNGTGIAPDDLPHIFEPYFTKKRGGTGLGLAIVRQTVHDHGGTITADSVPGSGATFTVVLPAESA
jgi:signal transduction histidine kinase